MRIASDVRKRAAAPEFWVRRLFHMANWHDPTRVTALDTSYDSLMNTTRIAITTTDTAYAATHEVDSTGRVIVEINDSAIERLTFAGRDMIRFDLQSAGKLPRDFGNRYAMYPSTRIVK